MNILFPLLLLSLFSCSDSVNASSVDEKPYVLEAVASSSNSSLSWLFDPLAPHSWHLGNYGQKSFASKPGKPGWDPGIGAVHRMGYSGRGIRIAVSDTGLETTHEDLSENMLDGEHRNYKLSGSVWVGDPETDGMAHGTSVSGLIAATGGNGVGSRGVAYGAKVAGFRYLSSKNWSLAKYLDQANGNFDIFNYSYTYYSCYYVGRNNSYVDQLKYGVTKLRNGKGAIYVKAAGNNYLSSLSSCTKNKETVGSFFGNTTLQHPHNWPYQIIVGAYNADGVRSSYSSPGSALWISAPGGEYGYSKPAMVTTDLSGCDQGYSTDKRYGFNGGKASNGVNVYGSLNRGCNYTSSMNGTSAASPVTAGIVALMLEANSALTWRDVKYILAKTAGPIHYDIGARDHKWTDRRLSGHIYLPDWVTNGAGFRFHNWYGFGGVNAKAAVEMAENYTSPFGGAFTESSWVASGSLSLSIPDASAVGVAHTLNVSDDFVIEGVQIELNAKHSRVSDLGVELTSPEGTHSIVIPINSNINVSDINGWILSSNAFYMEKSRGNWSIKLIDGMNKNSDGETATGTLTEWKIRFFGH